MSKDPHSDLQFSEYTVESLSRTLGYSYHALRSVLARIDSKGYVQFLARNGRKARVISAPAPWLARAQQLLVRRVLCRAPISDVVYSTVGRDPIKNARVHVGRPFMLVMDIADCYPSVHVGAVRDSLLAVGFSRDVAGLITRIATFHGCLPQGAPSSAAILNLVLRAADESLLQSAADVGATYTRYADDLCFSSDSSLLGFRKRAIHLLNEQGFTVRPAKTRLYGPRDMKVLTKIVVADPFSPIPEFVAELDAMLQAFACGSEKVRESSIRGKIAWVERLNPVQARALLEKLGSAKQKREMTF